MTTAIEYLQALEEELKYLPAKDVRKVIQVYQEKINNALDYGEKIEKILKDLPTPAEVAKGIYDSKKVNYLTKRQKEYRRKELVNGFTSLILAVIVILTFIGIIGYLGIISINMLSIIPKFNAQDKIIMSGFVISYFIAMIVVIVYLFDLGWFIASFLLGKFLDIFKEPIIKAETLQDFSITGFFDKITKKKSFLGKVLLVLGLIMVVFGATSVVSDGYLNRSFSDNVSLDNKEEVLVDSSVETVVLDNLVAKVTIQEGSEFKIIKHSEFERSFKTTVENNVLTISFDQKQSYDFLGLLNEPTIVVIIEIPSDLTKSVDLKLNNGQVTVNKVNLDKLNVTLSSGNLTLKDANINSFTYTTDDAQTNSNNCEYKEVLFELNQGRFASSEDYYQNANITNGSGEIAIKNNKFDNLKLKNISGTVVVNQTEIKMYDYTAVASILTMSEIDSEYFNLTSTNSSQFTMEDLEAKLFTFDLNTGYINISKIVGDINIVKSLSNITLDELVGDVNGTVEASTLAVYNSIFDNLKVNLTGCNLDLDGVTIKNIDITATKTQSIFLDVYSDKINLEFNNSNLEYYNNTTKPVGDIYIKGVNSKFDIKETVKYASLVEE
ncbi:MAG: DUF4097 family beta strand repeat protein [Bacilli bacterium]|nr:DUF4097 family beta strand repeat protein [Bacilli bacterium]